MFYVVRTINLLSIFVVNKIVFRLMFITYSNKEKKYEFKDAF